MQDGGKACSFNSRGRFQMPFGETPVNKCEVTSLRINQPINHLLIKVNLRLLHTGIALSNTEGVGDGS